MPLNVLNCLKLVIAFRVSVGTVQDNCTNRQDVRYQMEQVMAQVLNRMMRQYEDEAVVMGGGIINEDSEWSLSLVFEQPCYLKQRW